MNQKKEYYFPEGFWWGSASSAAQSEGAADRDGKSPSIWDYWYSIEPQRFHDQIGPQDTSGFYDHYKEDIKLLKELGHNSFRTGIQWSRLIPDGQGEVNQKAVDFYNDVFNELIALGIEPIVTLYHFDMPLALQQIGGWESREVVDAFTDYAKICFELFGDRVKFWVTFNEPVVPVEGGYLYDFHYPNVIDGRRAVQVGFNEILASAKAIEAYHKMELGGKIGIVLNVRPTYPRDPDNQGDIEAALAKDIFFNRSFLDPCVKGIFPKKLIKFLLENEVLPEYSKQDLKIIRDNTIDFLGVNYYSPSRAKERETKLELKEGLFMPDIYFKDYVWPEAKMNPYRGWEIYEKGIYDICKDIIENYDNIPFYISENGMGVESEERFLNEDGIIEDNYRIDFIKDHLRWLHKAIQEGANCMGYHLWTFIDNWSWCNAYKNRYGLVSLDLDTQKRTVKKSGRWFKELSDNNGFAE